MIHMAEFFEALGMFGGIVVLVAALFLFAVLAPFVFHKPGSPL